MDPIHPTRHYGALLLLGSLLLVACGPDAASTPTAVAPTATAPPAPTAAATSPATGKVTKIGLVTDVGHVDDKGYQQAIWTGVQQAAKDLGAQAVYIETANPTDFSANIEQMVSQGADPVVTSGFSLGAATEAAARKHPTVQFIGIDQAIDASSTAAQLNNYAGLIFEEDKAGFLAGALAAQMTKTNNVGAILGTDVIPALWRFGEGFRAGAQYIQPPIALQIMYHSDVDISKTFSDPAWGKTTALAMITKGADVIFGAAGNTSTGALQACAEQRQQGKMVYAIGVDVDQYYTVPEAGPALLSSAQKLLAPGVAKLIHAAADGTFKGGINVGEVGLAPFHEFDAQVPAAVKTRMQEIVQGLRDGTIKTKVPPAKP
ncbi:MAG TPA: BMP family ABC transporter substrate-binding protein [Chloroflexia bacterium]|nr:BMP family ABC transporter substrate-binding protein [Chloroflexia bacterium]